MATITAANSVLMLSVRGLFPVPQQIQGYSADDAFATEAVEPAETVMGVDGRMSAGYVPYMTMITVSIMPDSPSNGLFDAWLAAQKAANEVYIADAIITLPAISRTYICTYGVLSSIQPFPGVRKVLQARPFRLTWESVVSAPF